MMHVKFIELPVIDQRRALAFYENALGVYLVQDRPYGEDGWRWLEVALPGGQTHILLSGRGGVTAERPAMVLVDPDIETLAQRLRGVGANILTDVSAAPWDKASRYFEFSDAEGNRLVITER